MKSQGCNSIEVISDILCLLFSLGIEVWLARSTLLRLMLEVHAAIVALKDAPRIRIEELVMLHTGAGGLQLVFELILWIESYSFGRCLRIHLQRHRRL